MTNFLAFHCQHWNALPIARLKIAVAVYIYDFEMKWIARPQFLQVCDHILAKMAMLPLIDRKQDRESRIGSTHLSVFAVHLHGNECSGIAALNQQGDIASFLHLVEQLVELIHRFDVLIVDAQNDITRPDS